METDKRRGIIEVWRPADFTQLELQRGFSVARPVPRHWHEEYQLCLIQSGAGELNYRGNNYPTPAASLFIVHPGEVHSNRAYDEMGCSYRTVFLDPELMRDAATEIRGKEKGLPFFPTAVLFDATAIDQYLEFHRAYEEQSSSLERQSRLLDLLTDLIRRFAEKTARPRSFGTERQAIRRACDYMTEHYAENLSLEDLARIANLSPFHFNRVFAEQMGAPPHAFQTQLRVCRAKALLKEGWEISQAASQTGFADQSHLTRHFKRLVGVTPGRYLQNSKNVQDRFLPTC
jgi:AraC-like DNA-binding protein